ncbi:MAG: hypothetical protein AAGE01_09095 [Pseudomonadota bacterium]
MFRDSCVALLLFIGFAGVAAGESDGNPKHESPLIRPVNGLWWNPAEPGYAVSVDAKLGAMTVILASYDDAGQATWTVANGLFGADGRFSADRQAFDGGSCVNCLHSTPDANVAGTIQLDFISARFAFLAVDGGDRVPIRSFDFADRPFQYPEPVSFNPEFGRGSVPVPLGQWIFVAADGSGEVIGTWNFDFVFQVKGFDEFGFCDSLDDGSSSECLICSGNSQSETLSLCRLDRNTGDGIETVFHAFVGDIGTDRIVAYRTAPTIEGAAVQAGEGPVLGFRIRPMAEEARR